MNPKIFNQIAGIGVIIGLIVTGFIGYYKLLNDVYFYYYFDVWSLTRDALYLLGIITLVLVSMTAYLGYIADNDISKTPNILARIIAFCLGVIGWFCLVGNIYLLFW
jgi:ABC-type microcin C transport system permease subunit YejE